MKKKNSQSASGQALLMAIIFLLALTILGFGLILVSSVDTHSSRNLRLNEQALNVAEEGALMAMAYASDPASGDFIGLAPGDSITLNSVTHAGKNPDDPLHYEVKIIKGSQTETPAGQSIGTTGSGQPVIWISVRIQSTGMVREEGGAFSFINRPPIQRRVEVIARIKTFG